MLAASAGQVVSIDQSASRAALARSSAARILPGAPRPHHHGQPAQKAQDRIAPRPAPARASAGKSSS